MKSLMPLLTALIIVASPAFALVEGEFLYEFGAGFFQNSIGQLAVNEQGQIIVGDAFSKQMNVFDSCGNFLLQIPTEEIALSVAVNFDGQILALSDTAGIAYVYSPQGELLFKFGMGNLIPGAVGACFNEAGDMILCDTARSMIVVFDSCGNFLFNFGMQGAFTEEFMSPQGICTDSDGNIYVSDTNNNRVQVFDPKGKFLFAFGSGGVQPGQFRFNAGIAVSPFGEIAVADPGNQRVQIFDECGNLLNILTGPPISGPVGVAFNEDGILYIADNSTRKVLAYR